MRVMKLLNLCDSMELLHPFSLTSFLYIFHVRAKSIECAAKSIKPVELADEGRVQNGARDVAVRMRIVSNMKRTHFSYHIQIYQIQQDEQ